MDNSHERHSSNSQENLIISAIAENDLKSVEKIITNNPKLVQCTNYNIEVQSKIRGSILPLNSLSLMHIAAFYDSLEIFVYLEQEQQLSPSILSASSLHPIHYAVYNNSLEVATYILESHPEEAQIETTQSYALFYCAASSLNSTDDRMIELLHSKDAPFLPSKDNSLCPIQKAIKLKNIPVLKGLLKVYNSKRRKNSSDKEKDVMTPLMTSISYGVSSGVDLLLEAGEDPMFMTPCGRCALSHACFVNRRIDGKDSSYEIIEKLLNAIGQCDIEPAEKCKSGPIQWICQAKSPQIAKLLFDSHPEIDVNRLDENFISAPTTLAKKNMPSQEVIEMLSVFIQKGYDLNRFDLEKGQKTILESFCFTIKPNVEIVKFLLEMGSDPFLPFVGNNKMARKGTIFRNALSKHELKQIMIDYEKDHINPAD